MKYFFFALIILGGVTPFSFGQNTFLSISGHVIDKTTGENLIGASIETPDGKTGAITNEYGFFSISLPITSDSSTLIFSYLGYSSLKKVFIPKKELSLKIGLNPDGFTTDEVVIEANTLQDRVRSTEMSVTTISSAEIKKIPAIFGEVDLLKTIQLKSGINPGSEGTTGLFVRGGAGDQNLIVLDEAIVYNANHLFGFFSTFNNDAVKDVKVFKGGFPAQYGGRLSSVIDVRMKEGNNQKFSGSGGIGLIASRLTLEGPIKKGKSSFIVSGRRTYVDLITNAVNASRKDDPNFSPIPAYYFYDLNTKANFYLSAKDHLYVSGYFGRDVFAFSNDNFNAGFNWGNATGTARWNHTFGQKLFSNTTFTFSDYQYNISNKFTGFSFNIGSKIQDATLKTDFYYTPNKDHQIKFGVGATNHDFTVSRLNAGSTDGSVSFSQGSKKYGVEFWTYANDEWTINNKWKVNPGLRLSGFNANNATYFGIEPRISTNYSVKDGFSLKGSYARTYQYVHLISNSGISLPTDVWYPSTANVKPQYADQIAVGGSYLLGKNILITNEYWYKKMYNQIDFIDGAQLFANNDLETQFAFGRGYSYGAELEIEKKKGKLTGWIAYTLGYVRRGDFPGIMNGRFFAPRYDRRHNLNVVAIWEINRRISLSGTFNFGSGDLSWLPGGRMVFQDTYGEPFNPVVPVYGDRNTFRLPNYHRADLGCIIKFFPKWGESDLTISIYNVYNRRNAFFIYLQPEFPDVPAGQPAPPIQTPTRIAARQTTLFPILPALTYNFKF
jgi:hypothetical protein